MFSSWFERYEEEDDDEDQDEDEEGDEVEEEDEDDLSECSEYEHSLHGSPGRRTRGKLSFVTDEGHRSWEAEDGDEVSECENHIDQTPGSRTNGPLKLPEVTKEGLFCPDCGDPLELKVSREMMGYWNKNTWTCQCDACGREIGWNEARHRCKECNYDVCSKCGQRLQAENISVAGVAGQELLHSALGMPQEHGTPPIQVGDIVFCGPDDWGIHHIILVTGPLIDVPEYMGQHGVPRGVPVYCFASIESTDSAMGWDSAWVTAHRLCYVDPQSGEIMCQGEIVEGTNYLGYFDTHQQFKVLQHPFRPNSGRMPFNDDAFQQTVSDQRINSKKWSLRTALQAINRNTATEYDPEEYENDPEARAELLEDIQRSWRRRPICSSVAISVWQCYLLYSCTSAVPGPEGEDLAVQEILRWIPLICGRAAPYDVMKTLSRCGWHLTTHC